MSAASRVSCPARLSFMYVASRSLSLIHISEPTRLGMISYAVFCLRLPHLSIRRQRQMCIRDTFVASALDVRSVTGLLPCPALLHVRRIALLPHPAPFVQCCVRASPYRLVESVLLVQQELAARLRAAPDRGHGVTGEVVVVEVLVGQATQRLDPLGSEEAALLD